jgi:hypothetical protein
MGLFNYGWTALVVYKSEQLALKKWERSRKGEKEKGPKVSCTEKS